MEVCLLIFITGNAFVALIASGIMDKIGYTLDSLLNKIFGLDLVQKNIVVKINSLSLVPDPTIFFQSYESRHKTKLALSGNR